MIDCKELGGSWRRRTYPLHLWKEYKIDLMEGNNVLAYVGIGIIGNWDNCVVSCLCLKYSIDYYYDIHAYEKNRPYPETNWVVEIVQKDSGLDNLNFNDQVVGGYKFWFCVNYSPRQKLSHFLLAGWQNALPLLVWKTSLLETLQA